MGCWVAQVSLGGGWEEAEGMGEEEDKPADLNFPTSDFLVLKHKNRKNHTDLGHQQDVAGKDSL